MNNTAICRTPSEYAAVVRPILRHKRVSAPLSFFLLLFLPSLLLFLSAPARAPAQEVHPTESQVKAAYLYSFGKFVRWQADRDPSADSREICVLGKDTFGPVLDSTVAGESFDGRRIVVRRPAKVQDTTRCSILFISSSEENRLGVILAAVQRSPVLTVSDIPHFAERGGIIAFVNQQGRIRFEVNRRAAELAHLALSSELLKVAIKVIDKDAAQAQP